MIDDFEHVRSGQPGDAFGPTDWAHHLTLRLAFPMAMFAAKRTLKPKIVFES